MTQNQSAINVSVTFRHTESTEALKSYAIEKSTNCLRKYVVSETEATVVLSVEKRDHLAEINVTSSRYKVSAKFNSDNLYAAIDGMVDSLSAQLRKQKEKLVSHK